MKVSNVHGVFFMYTSKNSTAHNRKTMFHQFYATHRFNTFVIY